MKSLWRENQPSFFRFYCPTCGVERRVALTPSPQPRHYFQVAIAAALVMIAGFSWWKFKGLWVFVPLWIIFETVYRLKARAQMACDQCGFDPYLFLADSDRAKEAMRVFWKKKTEPEPAPLDGPPPQR